MEYILIDSRGYSQGKGRPADLPQILARNPGWKQVSDRHLVESWRPEARLVEGKWTYPTERWWLLQERLDQPGVAYAIGDRLVWPERLPVIGENQYWTWVAPPETLHQKPLYNLAEDEWFFPQTVCIFDDEGVFRGRQLATQATEEDVVDEGLTVEDELGEVRPLEVGDRRNPDGTFVAQPRQYAKVSVRFFWSALNEHGLEDAFVNFLQAEGFSRNDFLELKAVSLNNKLVRAFLEAQGVSLRAAYENIQMRAEQAAENYRKKQQTLEAE